MPLFYGGMFCRPSFGRPSSNYSTTKIVALYREACSFDCTAVTFSSEIVVKCITPEAVRKNTLLLG